MPATGAWIDVETARTAPGLRLVLSAGVPGPWGESAKGICFEPGGGVNSNVVLDGFGLVFQSEKFAQNCGWPGSPE